ncbi:MAG: RsmE family RNA methyltransferase [Acidimicrobiales bacterium]
MAAHVFVEDLVRPALTAEDFHHLAHVLRLRPGEAVSVADGRGSWRLCYWDGSASLCPDGDVVGGARAPAPALTVAFVLTKGSKPEWTVQKLTEAGIDRIVVMTSARGVVRWHTERAARQLGRLRVVAREAAMQSRRLWLPSVSGPVPFETMATEGGVALSHISGAPLTLGTPTVLVGPEGGWSDDELACVPVKVRLGPHVLRAETAAVAAGIMLSALREGLVSCAAPGAASVGTPDASARVV